jgi:predicted ABC-type ATPase
LRIRPAGEVINTDDFARRINTAHPEFASLSAGRQVLDRIADLIAAGADFNFETTLSSHPSLAVMRQARVAGYRVELAYIVLRSRELHVPG